MTYQWRFCCAQGEVCTKFRLLFCNDETRNDVSKIDAFGCRIIPVLKHLVVRYLVSASAGIFTGFFSAKGIKRGIELVRLCLCLDRKKCIPARLTAEVDVSYGISTILEKIHGFIVIIGNGIICSILIYHICLLFRGS